MGSFATDTAVARDADGALGCTVEQDWWVVAGPNGGYLAAIVVHALETRVDTAERPLRSLTVQYQRAPKPGPAQIEVVIEREGRSVTFARVTLRQGDRLALSALAVLARPAGGDLRLAAASPPRVPGPDAIEALPDAPAEAPPFGRHFDYRPAVGGARRRRGGDRRLAAPPRGTRAGHGAGGGAVRLVVPGRLLRRPRAAGRADAGPDRAPARQTSRGPATGCWAGSPRGPSATASWRRTPSCSPPKASCWRIHASSRWPADNDARRGWG